MKSNYYKDFEEAIKANSIEEVRDRRAKCLTGPLKSGEKFIWLDPAYELFDDNPRQNYGRHGVQINFAERRGSLAISTSFYTNMDITPSPSTFDLFPMCTGLYYHHQFKKDADEYASTLECSIFSKGVCHGEAGSAIYGEKIVLRLIHEGSAGVWDEIDKAFQEVADEKQQ